LSARRSRMCFYEAKENVPPAFKQYKTQGNASNLVQSHFGSPHSFELESGIAPLVPRGFDPACWGLNQPPPSPLPSLISAKTVLYRCLVPGLAPICALCHHALGAPTAHSTHSTTISQISCNFSRVAPQFFVNRFTK